MALGFLEEEVERLRSAGLLRDCRAPLARVGSGAERGGSDGLVDACSNDYLGYGGSVVSRETTDRALEQPLGARASRLVHGTHPAHLALEAELADWVRLPSALLFSSGYAANVGVVPALARQGDTIYSDALNHASLIDGCQLSRAQVVIFPHLDLSFLAAQLSKKPPPGQSWILTESYFSMDGDCPDLLALRKLADRHGAHLLVDEAHALGVYGPSGAGRSAMQGIVPDILVGTLGKAVASQGAFVAGSETLRTWLWNRARSFVFSTAPSPLVASLTLASVRAARRDDFARTRLAELSRRFRLRLADSGVPIPPSSEGPIVPVILGANHAALQAERRLREAGVLAQAIRPPTVPSGTSRLRITLNANMSDEALARIADTLARTCAAS